MAESPETEYTEYIHSLDEDTVSVIMGYRLRAQEGAEVVASVLSELEGFAATKGGITFTDAQPFPVAAFDRLVRERQAEIDAALGSSGGGRGR
ncbi:hypothetical protein [Pseudolysinimonas sp.]|uniref:hypothetical protein n=1 Tax=Pseudolysinimonas sp. TaxID=2680009 RepID=UPI00286AF7A6|nr:hypothetical protein [Pseudolysinimonas sp.]